MLIDQTPLDFHPLTPALVPQILAYTRAAQGRICDKTLGNLFMWARQNDTRYAAYAGMHLLRSRWNGRLIYACPVGEGDFAAALSAIAADARAQDEPLAFASLTEVEADRIAAYFAGSERRTSEDWSDYLYPAEALATLAGRAYHAPRNHINRFLVACPDYNYHPLTPEQIDEVSTFFARQRVDADDGTASAAAEADATADMLALYPALVAAGAPLLGGVLRAGREVIGFSIGEIGQDTLFVHIEKGNTAYHGVYPMLVRDFARTACDAGVGFINREEDDGNPGLRRSKLAYHPTARLNKFMLLCR